LFVANFGQHVIRRDLFRAFKKYGFIVDIQICNGHGNGPRYAFVEFRDREQANAAIKDNNDNNKGRHGKEWRITWARRKTQDWEEHRLTLGRVEKNVNGKHVSKAIEAKTGHKEVNIIFDRNTALPVALVSSEKEKKILMELLKEDFQVYDDTGQWTLGLHRDNKESDDDIKTNGSNNDDGAGVTSLDALNQYSSQNTSQSSTNSDNDVRGPITQTLAEKQNERDGNIINIDLESYLEPRPGTGADNSDDNCCDMTEAPKEAEAEEADNSDDLIVEEIIRKEVVTQKAKARARPKKAAASHSIDVSGGGD
jgi:hypothetical protein